MNLILCGMMGSGKTTIGKELAKSTGWRLCDTDGIIVERHGKIADIFATHGEGYFRDLETSVAKELAEENGLVISTGGGLVLRQENVEALQKNGKIIFLRATIETLIKRLQSDGERPLLHSTAESLEEKLTRLLQARTAVYERAADCVVDVDGKTPEQIAAEILAAIAAK